MEDGEISMLLVEGLGIDPCAISVGRVLDAYLDAAAVGLVGDLGGDHGQVRARRVEELVRVEDRVEGALGPRGDDVAGDLLAADRREPEGVAGVGLHGALRRRCPCP